MKANYQDALKWMAEKSPFITKLRQLMGANNTTQEQLANAIGVSRQTVSGYTLGQAMPDIYRVQQIADYFKIDVGYLLSKQECFALNTHPTEIRDILTQIIMGLEKLREVVIRND